MLALTRRVGEEIVIGGAIRITVIAVRGDRVRLGVTAPASVRVDRQEVHIRRALQGATGFATELDTAPQLSSRESSARSSVAREGPYE